MTDDINELEFTVFDTETTGLNPAAGDRIVELAGLRVKGQARIAKFDCLVNPHRAISEGAFAVNKITSEMLQNASGIEDVMPKFLEFILVNFQPLIHLIKISFLQNYLLFI